VRQNAGILNRRGFSLIELLVVTAILGVVIAAIAGSLAGGIKVWDAARNFNEGEAAAALALAELERDLVNSFDFFDLSFSGHKDGMAFPGVVSDPEHGHMAVGLVSFAVDERTGRLLKKVQPYKAGREYSEVLADGIEAFEIAYYNMATVQGSGRTWVEAGAVVTGFPARVDIRLALLSGSGAGEMSRTVLLPTRLRR